MEKYWNKWGEVYLASFSHFPFRALLYKKYLNSAQKTTLKTLPFSKKPGV